MALINCPECGKEISDKATACIHCGCPLEKLETIEFKATLNEPIDKNIKSSHKNSGKKKLKPWHFILIIAGILIAVFIGILILGATVSIETEKTKENITPYLEYIGTYVPTGEYLDIDDGLFAKKSDVYFMGMKGQVSFDTDENYVYKCKWMSDEAFKEEEYQKKIDDLYLYFDVEPTFITKGYNTGDTYIYYFTDSNNDFSVTCSRNFIMYDSEGYIEITWEAEGEVLEKFKESSEVNSGETVDERTEATDYDEFKSAVEECIQYVPDCQLTLNYTDNNESYSINLDNEIIGIFGTKINTWDVVALIDPDIDNAQLHHEQISIALIMSCDSDVTYEEAKKIFDEATTEGSAKISTGKYFFEGVVDGMHAGGVDITWLGSSF